MSEGDTYSWEAGDYSNIITISASALASVLLVIFKSKCTKISFLWGLWSCDRNVPDDAKTDEENNQNNDDNNNNQNNNDNNDNQP